MANITRHPRYLPDIQWSENSLTHNAFRLYELIFWRRVGIRAEMFMSSWVEDGVRHTVYHCCSWESVLAFTETSIRNALSFRPRFKRVRIWIPVMQTPQGIPVFASPYILAIAFVRTSTTVNPASNTVAFDATATNGYLVVQTLKASSQTVSGVTYNGVATTQIMSADPSVPFSTQNNYLWGLAAPTTGTNNIVVSDSGAGTLVVDAALYSGAQQTTAIEATGTNSGALGTTASVSVTTITNNAWLVGYFRANSASGSFTAGSNTVVRTDSAESTRQMADSGADQTPAGSFTLTATMVIADWQAMAFSLKPLAGGTVVRPRSTLLFMGVG